VGWRDFVETQSSVHVDATFADGQSGRRAARCDPLSRGTVDEALTRALFRNVASDAGLAPQTLPDGVRISRRGALTYVFNYGATPYRIDAPGSFIVGQQEVEPQGVAIYAA